MGSRCCPQRWGEDALTDLPAIDGVYVEAPVILPPQHPRQCLPQAALQQGDLLPHRQHGAQHLHRQERPLVAGAFQPGSSVDVDEP